MKELLLKRLIYCILIIFLLLNVFNVNYNVSICAQEASEDISPSTGSGGNSGGNFDLSLYGNDATPSDGTNATEIREATTTLAGIIVSGVRVAATGIALIMITIIAIKYILAAPGDRADLKKSSFQYIVGAIIVFGSAQILGILIDSFSGLFK